MNKLKYCLLILVFSCTYNIYTIKGTYGSYADYSLYTELTLNDDSTYLFKDITPENKISNEQGTWTVHHNKLILKSFDNKSLRQFRIKGYSVCPITQKDKFPCLKKSM